MLNFSKRQWLTLITISIADFCNAICVSLQAPFYPLEAESKGCTATEYGLVFGLFELVVFVISPIYGQHLNKLGAHLVFNSGIYTTGVCCILFGFLDKIPGHYTFLGMSYLIRIIEALGNAAFLTASFAIIAKEFPDNVATTFATVETFFGFGLIVGPTVGGGLYQIGGYTTPFAVMGLTLFGAAILTAFVLPKQTEPAQDRAKGPSILKALKIPGLLLSASSIIVTSMSIGFLQATLEPHLRQFQLAPFVLGLMFVLNGGTYAVTAPIFGRLCDRYIPPKVVIIMGTVFVSGGFCLVGPAPFFSFNTTLWVSIIGLVLHGLGMSAQLVATFTDSLRTTVAHGFENNLETFGLVSGFWTSVFALGAFFGPCISGFLFDKIGFRNSCMFVVGCHLVVGVMTILYLIFSKESDKYVELKEDKAPNPEVVTIAASSRLPAQGFTESIASIKSLGNGISIQKSRPTGMNSLIACNSYKSQAWPNKREVSGLGPFSQSYGAFETRNFKGVA